MAWLRDDDDMLDHEKWRRAIRDGGDGVLLLWSRLRSWCSRRLTDGVVPPDMVDEIGQIGRSKSRAKQLRALVDARLLAWCDDGDDVPSLCRGDAEPTPRAQRAHDVLVVVGYLERNPSKADVLAERGRRAQAQKNYKDRQKVTGHPPIPIEAGGSGADDVPSRPVPSRPPGEEREERAREPDPEPDGITEIPDDWVVTEAFAAEAWAAGVDAPTLDDEVRYWRERASLPSRFRTPEGFFRTRFSLLAKRRETATFRARDNPHQRLQAQADRVRMLRAQEAEEERLGAAGGVAS